MVVLFLQLAQVTLVVFRNSRFLMCITMRGPLHFEEITWQCDTALNNLIVKQIKRFYIPKKDIQRFE